MNMTSHNRIKHLLCGHGAVHVEDYGDESHLWRIRCRTCGEIEHWSQSEWRQSLRARLADESSEDAGALIKVDEEPGEA